LKKEVGDRWGTALVLGNLATAAYDQGKLADAVALSEESLELFRALADKAGIAWAFETLGVVAEDEDEYGKAAAFYQESLALYREVEEKEGIKAITDERRPCTTRACSSTKNWAVSWELPMPWKVWPRCVPHAGSPSRPHVSGRRRRRCAKRSAPRWST
jgi:tetratricopeptide (TPR) repeat protein